MSEPIKEEEVEEESKLMKWFGILALIYFIGISVATFALPILHEKKVEAFDEFKKVIVEDISIAELKKGGGKIPEYTVGVPFFTSIIDGELYYFETENTSKGLEIGKEVEINLIYHKNISTGEICHLNIYYENRKGMDREPGNCN